MLIVILVIFLVMMSLNRILDRNENFQLLLPESGNFNPFIGIPEELITWKPYAVEWDGQPNYSAYFYKNNYMVPIY
jgi:hypothetical protein